MREVPGREIKKQLDRYIGRVIPVQTAVEARQRVLDTSAVEMLLRGAEAIAVEDCWCRKNYGNCDGPLDVCLSLNDTARRFVAEGWSRPVSLEEALDTLRRTHQAGLVHMTYEERGQPPELICSCCSCCCHHLVGLLRYGYTDTTVRSDLMATHDPDLCTACGVCVERCHFGAWGIESGVVRFLEGNCFGCGLCASECPAGAIALVSRAAWGPIESQKSQ